MPIPLHDFIASHQKNGEESLIQKMYINPPQALDSIKSEFYSQEYLALMSLPDFDYDLLHLKQLLLDSFVMRRSAQKLLEELPEDIDIKEDALSICIKSTIFDITGMANCSGRASYAAFKLHEILEGSLDVFVKSAKKTDQFVVYIGRSPTWFIYDPLTNPGLIFSLEEYRKKVLPLFGAYPSPVMAAVQANFQVKITPKLRSQYQIVRRLYDEMLTAEVNGLDPYILKHALRLKYEQSLLESACQQLKEKCGARQEAGKDKIAEFKVN